MTISVSVVLPVFNGMKTIEATLESILHQTDPPDELLICDDGSTDGTPNFCRSRLRNTPWAHIIEFQSNAGYAAHLARAIQLAKKDVIVLLAADDLVHPNFLGLVRREFMRQPTVLALSRPYFWFEESPHRPTRIKDLLPGQAPQQTLLLNSKSSPELLAFLLRTTDQLSGLAFRNTSSIALTSQHFFTAHCPPFINALLSPSGQVAMLGHFYLAVQTSHSQTRSVSSGYDTSPLGTWVQLIEPLTSLLGMAGVRKIRQRFARDAISGLPQILHHSNQPRKFVLREVILILKNKPGLVYSMIGIAFAFWAVLLGRNISQRIFIQIKPTLTRIAIAPRSRDVIRHWESEHQLQY
jgi:hypothetical protein